MSQAGPEQALPRLFVGVAIPLPVAAELAKVTPDPAPGIRPVDQASLHVTLHFIGPGQVEEIRAALKSVTSNGFTLNVCDLGSFAVRGRRHILWAAVDESDALLALHGRIGTALAATGFEPESRPFRPHITLARFSRRADDAVLTACLAAGRRTEFGRFAVRQYVLFESRRVAGTQAYVPLVSFDLQ